MGRKKTPSIVPALAAVEEEEGVEFTRYFDTLVVFVLAVLTSRWIEGGRLRDPE